MKHPKIVKIENVAYTMPVWYSYGHEVTPLSVARTEYHSLRLRAERREMLKRLAFLQVLTERRWNDAKGLLKKIDDLHDDAEEMYHQSEMALHIANNDKQSLLSTVERLQAENERLTAENREQATKLQAVAEYDKEIRKRLAHIRKLGDRLARQFEKQSKRLHDCRADRRKWRDTAERCYAAAMKNAVALADERKGETGA